jgi:hypothetical protein
VTSLVFSARKAIPIRFTRYAPSAEVDLDGPWRETTRLVALGRAAVLDDVRSINERTSLSTIAASEKGHYETHAAEQVFSLFDHLVCAGEQKRPDAEAERSAAGSLTAASGASVIPAQHCRSSGWVAACLKDAKPGRNGSQTRVNVAAAAATHTARVAPQR